MKQYLLGVQIDEDRPLPPKEEYQALYAAVDAFNEEIQAAGVWVFGGGLHPSPSSTVVRVREGDVIMTDGPFAETKEQLGGFWVIRAADLDEALRWARKAAVACGDPVEVRPFQDDAED